MRNRNHKNNCRWAVSSPSLIAKADNIWPGNSWFKNWDLISFNPLDGQPEARLGLHFEAIVKEWIKHEPTLTLISANLPVRHQGQTIGEFDLLVSKNGILEHWELAVKFFLGIGNRKKADHWIGPNPEETLEKKFSHMKYKQLRLDESSRAREILDQRRFSIKKKRAFFKGRLFHPFKAFEDSNFEIPQNVNPEHQRGWWICDKNFRGNTYLKNQTFALLEKNQWLAPIEKAEDKDILKPRDLLEKIEENEDRPLHVAILDTFRDEISRGFIVTTQWLNAVFSIHSGIEAGAVCNKDHA